MVLIESTTLLIVVGIFLLGAILFVLAYRRVRQEEAEEFSKAMNELKRKHDYMDAKWKAERDRANAVWVERNKRREPIRMCSEVDENEHYN